MANTNKALSASVKAGALILHGVGKKLSANAKITPSVLHGIGKNINASVKLSASIPTKTAVLTMVYKGNAELGLGAEEGAQFDIIVTGTFTVFSISMNGKTLTYTENCVAQTITIDNINATVKNGAVNKLSMTTGDIADFLKLIPGNNIITISKTGGSVDLKFNFRAQYI